MPIFICPQCGTRAVHGDRSAGFSSRPRGCEKCGYGFIFELLDDYYPATGAAFFVCDQESRVIGCGKGSFELTGLTDVDVFGRPVREVLGLEFGSGDDPIATTLEWGVRSIGHDVEVRAEGDIATTAVADIFPAYDEDGGMLLVLTPEN
jgi:PAS domain-containing protein